MGAQSGGRPAVAVVAITVLAAAVVVVGASVASGTHRRVILYGDSLAFEAKDAFAVGLQHGNDIEVVDRTFSGTAICDWLDRMHQDLHDLQPGAVVFEFAGNNVTPCVQGPDGPLTGAALAQRYRDDARTATGIFTGAGVRAYWMGAPPVTGPQTADFTLVRHVYETEGGREPPATPVLGAAEYVDAGRAVTERGGFTPTLPCLPSEGSTQGCVDGRIPVRALDGVHFCPVRAGVGTDRCPVYSSGAARFGLAMAAPVRRDLLGR